MKYGKMTKVDEDHFMSMAAGQGFNSISNLGGDNAGANSSNEGRKISSGSPKEIPQQASQAQSMQYS